MLSALVALLRAQIFSTVIPGVSVIAAPGMVCPSPDAVEVALDRVRDGAAPAPGPAFRLFLDRTAERARIDLRDSAGASLLAREIPVTPHDCDHAAQAIALIVERHFRELSWSPPDAPRTPPPAPAAARAPSAAPSPGPSAAVTPPPGRTLDRPSLPGKGPSQGPPNPQRDGAREPSSHAPARLPRLVVAAGPTFWTREGGTFALALGARLRPADLLHVGMAVLVPPFHATADLGTGTGGQAQAWGLPVLASVGVARSLGRLTVGVDASGLLTIERGESTGIAAPATAWRGVLAAGLGLAASWPLTARLRVAGALTGYRTLLGRSYVIAGIPGNILEPSSWQAMLTLGAEWIVRP